MKRNPEFLLRDVAGTLVVVPVGSAVREFSGMMMLNATGAYLWELLENEQTIESLTAALVERYEIGAEEAQADVSAFLEKLKPTGAVIL